LTIHILNQQNPAGIKINYPPRSAIPDTFSSLFKNPAAIESRAGENVKMPWITLVDSTLNFESDAPILTATPKDLSAS
jgi:hypothetical protein